MEDLLRMLANAMSEEEFESMVEIVANIVLRLGGARTTKVEKRPELSLRPPSFLFST